jgi:hypothetical protein
MCLIPHNSTKDPETANRDNADASDDVALISSSEADGDSKNNNNSTAAIAVRAAPLVIPHTYEQIIMYLDGRRSLRTMLSGSCTVRP